MSVSSSQKIVPPLALKTPSRVKLKLPPTDRYAKKSNKVTPAKETPKSSIKQTPKSSIKETPKSNAAKTKTPLKIASTKVQPYTIGINASGQRYENSKLKSIDKQSTP